MKRVPCLGGRDGALCLRGEYEGGDIACFRIKPDGSLDQRTAFNDIHGFGAYPHRQKKPYAHSIYTDPENKHVYSCDLGSDSVWTFNFNSDLGTLVPANPPAAKVPPGSGPRHLAFDPSGQFVFVANEMGHTVEVFSRDLKTGALTSIQNVDTLPPGTSDKGVTVAEVVCHPSGKWLYVSNRGCDTMAVFRIDGGEFNEGATDKLTLIQTKTAEVNFPRSFAIDPSGNFMIVAGQKDNRIAVLKIDQLTGMLDTAEQSAMVPTPVCVLFVPKNEVSQSVKQPD